MRLKIGVLVLALFNSEAATAADWVWIGSTVDAAYFIDASSIATVNQYKKAWIRVENKDFQPIESDPSKRYLSAKVLYYFDCKAKMSVGIKQTFYANANGSGSEVYSFNRKFSP